MNWIARLIITLTLLACSLTSARADDAHGRTARLRWVEGSVQLERADGSAPQDNRDEALRRESVRSGDLLRTGAGGRAEISLGASRLRLDEDSELLLRRLDEDRIVLQLRRGSLAARLDSHADALAFSLDTDAGHHEPLGAGLFRFDAIRSRWDDFSATAWRSPLRIEQNSATLTLRPGQRAELFSTGGWRLTTPESDAFARWGMGEDNAADRAAPMPVPPPYVEPPQVWVTPPQAPVLIIGGGFPRHEPPRMRPWPAPAFPPPVMRLPEPPRRDQDRHERYERDDHADRRPRNDRNNVAPPPQPPRGLPPGGIVPLPHPVPNPLQNPSPRPPVVQPSEPQGPTGNLGRIVQDVARRGGVVAPQTPAAPAASAPTAAGRGSPRPDRTQRGDDRGGDPRRPER